MKTSPRLVYVVIATACVACGDDDAENDNPQLQGCGSEQLGANGDVEFDELFALALRLRSADGTTSSTFLQCLDDVRDIDSVELTGAEFVGQWRAIGSADGVFMESSEDPRITRFEFVPSAGLVERETLSLAPVNFPSAGGTVVISETKAYSINFADLRIAIFDPSTMTLPSTETLSLPNTELTDEGFTTNGIFPELVGDLLYIAVAFADLSDLSAPRVDPGITVYIVDTNTDELVDVVVDPRCNHATGVAALDSGDIYFLGDNGFNLIDPLTEACIVRIRAGGQDFDPDYLFEPSSVLSGYGAFTPPGAPGPLVSECQASNLTAVQGSTAITYPLFASELDPDDPTSVAFDPVRRPWIIDLEAQTAEPAPIESIPLTRGVPAFRVDGSAWLGIADSFEQSNVYSIDPTTNSATLEFTTTGQLIQMQQVD
ncbi:MAG: hypothetical protein AAF219_05600 [Myxococcota bacterium]